MSGGAPSAGSWSDEDLASEDFPFFQKYGKSRVKTTEKVLLLFYAHNPNRQPPMGMERNIRLGAWCSSLEEIPETELMPLAEAVLRRHTTPFLPTPAAMIALRSGDEAIFDDEGKSGSVARSNVTAYESWEDQKARSMRAAQSSLPEAPVPLAISPEELMEKLRSPHIEIRSRKVEEAAAMMSDESLL